MSEPSVPGGVSEEHPPADGAQEAATPPVVGSASNRAIQVQAGPGVGQQVPPQIEFENVQVLSRFVIGGLILGGDELLQRLRYFQREIEASPGQLGRGPDRGEETTADLLRYLAIGLYTRGQKRVARGVRNGLYLSLGVTSSILGGLNRVTDNRLTRPLRRSAARRMRRLEEETAVLIDEGRREEEVARLLAGRTVGEIIDDFIDYLSTNPEVADLIAEQLGQQSVGLVSVVGENARQLAVIGDNLSEAVVRRILFRKPRRELPPSPLLGRPQTMYSPDTVVQGVEGDGQ